MRTGWRGTATRVCLVLCVLCLGAGEGVPPASAYRFLTSGGKKIGPFFPHGEEQKPRWNAAIWGLGTTMTVAVPDDPLWEKLDVIHGMEDARRLAADYGAERTMTKVLVARLEGNGRPRNAVIRITNEWGQFVIEGLDPGNYVVMAFSHRWGRPRESWVAIRQTVRLEPVQIRAGERTGPVVLTARRPVETE